MINASRLQRWIPTRWGTFLTVAVLYTGICALLLHPYFFHPASTVNGDNDVILNIWIMQWISHQLTVDPLHLFDANMFYPNKRTLSFSEILFPNALLSGVITFLGKNPILAYNFVFFLMIVCSALAMFYFTRYFTQNDLAAFIAGVIFAFPLINMGLLQLKSTFGIPLTFLFFFLYFQKSERRSLFFFCLFFVLQFLSCIYYGFYLIVCFGILFPFLVYGFRKNHSRRFFVWGVIGILAAGIVLSPFVYQYYQASKEYNIKRASDTVSGADLKDFAFLSLYKIIPKKVKSLKSLIRPQKRKASLGIIVLFFGIYGWVSYAKKRKKRIKPQNIPKSVSPRIFRVIKIVYLGLLSFVSVSIIIYHISGVKSLFFLFYTLTENNYIFYFRFAAIGFSLYLLYRYVLVLKDETQFLPKIFYSLLFIGILTLVFSMGENLTIFDRFYGTGPYVLLVKYLPGFSALRAYHRFSIITFFSLAFLAGWGAKVIIERIHPSKARYIFVLLLCLLLLGEYKLTGQKKGTYRYPHGQGIPEVYKWLKTAEGDKIIVEFPFKTVVPDEKGPGIRLNPKQTNPYLYYSTFHWKTLVNGRSGFFPRTDHFLSLLFLDFPTFDNIYLLKKMGVDYIIDHEFSEKYTHFAHSDGILRLEKQFDNDAVFSFNENYVDDWIIEAKSKESELIPLTAYKISPHFEKFEEGESEETQDTEQRDFPRKRRDFIVQFDFENPENIVKFEMIYPTIKMSAGALFFEVSGNGEDWEPISVFTDKYELFSEILEKKKKGQKRVYRLRYYLVDNKIKHFRMIKPDYSGNRVWFNQIDFFREKKEMNRRRLTE